MQQILLNIYNNAIKFTDRNGNITLLIEKVDNATEKKLVISVIDSGIGIKKKNQTSLFKLFGSIRDQKKKINT